MKNFDSPKFLEWLIIWTEGVRWLCCTKKAGTCYGEGKVEKKTWSLRKILDDQILTIMDACNVKWITLTSEAPQHEEQIFLKNFYNNWKKSAVHLIESYGYLKAGADL